GRGRGGADRGGRLHHAAGPARPGAVRAVRARAADHPAPLRAVRRAPADAGGGRPRVRGDPGADPPDRVQDPREAAPPVARALAARLPGLAAQAASPPDDVRASTARPGAAATTLPHRGAFPVW